MLINIPVYHELLQHRHGELGFIMIRQKIIGLFQIHENFDLGKQIDFVVGDIINTEFIDQFFLNDTDRIIAVDLLLGVPDVRLIYF